MGQLCMGTTGLPGAGTEGPGLALGRAMGRQRRRLRKYLYPSHDAASAFHSFGILLCRWRFKYGGPRTGIMVHIKDEGSQFDAPVDTVWEYLQTPDAHGRAHTGTRNQQMKPLTENSFELSMEQNMNGQWVRLASRITVFPPVAMTIEALEGPLAGSKMVHIYTPKGGKTGVDVYGDFTSKQIPPAQLEHAVRQSLEEMYSEDSAAIRAFAKAKG
jgi:hypothetical protein